MKQYYVYILQCNDDTYYTGVTNNIERRMEEHQLGKDPDSYVASRRPVRLVYSCPFANVVQAIAWEKKVKDWSRKKKEALIRGDFEALPELSRCTNETSHVHAGSRLRSN